MFAHPKEKCEMRIQIFNPTSSSASVEIKVFLTFSSTSTWLWVCKPIPCLTSSNLLNNTICDRFSSFHRNLSCFCVICRISFLTQRKSNLYFPTPACPCDWDLPKHFRFRLIVMESFHCVFKLCSGLGKFNRHFRGEQITRRRNGF